MIVVVRLVGACIFKNQLIAQKSDTQKPNTNHDGLFRF